MKRIFVMKTSPLLSFAILCSGALLLNACSTQNNEQKLINKEVSAGKINFAQGQYPLAFTDLLPAAEKGDKQAQYAVGYMYYYGKGTTQNIYEAKKWFEKSAQQGDPNAKKALAIVNKDINLQKNIFTAPAKSITGEEPAAG